MCSEGLASPRIFVHPDQNPLETLQNPVVES